MNFDRRSAALCGAWGVLCSLLIICVAGCGPKPELTTGDELAEFHRAGPLLPEMDVNQLLSAPAPKAGEYRLICGDLLEVLIPSVLCDITAENTGRSEDYQPHLCRVLEDGSIILPLIGRSVKAAGKTLAELEKAVIEAYHPRFSLTPPSIVADIKQHKTFKVSISGGVTNPGIYPLRHDEMSLVSLIMAAGGIVEDGATVISIDQKQTANESADDKVADSEATEDPDEPPLPMDVQLSFRATSHTFGTLLVKDGSGLLYSEQLDISDGIERRGFMKRLTKSCPGIAASVISRQLNDLSETLKPGSGDKAIALESEREVSEIAANQSKGVSSLLLPVKGLNIPFADVALAEGARIEVETLNPEVFTVVGLVNKSGAFPYPPNVQYNLMEALAFAEGVDPIADPRFVRVYRENAEGKMIAATFSINGTSPVGAPNIPIKPGDVIAVEQTPRTRRNLLLSEILAIRLGGSLMYQYVDGTQLYRKYDE